MISLSTLERIPTLRKWLAYEPWEGCVGKPRIGLQPLGDRPWFEFDEDKEIQLELKRYDNPFLRMGSASNLAEFEIANTIAEYLKLSYPCSSLHYVSQFVQDDLCIVEKIDGEWILTAASVSFPTGWKPEDAIGKSVNFIHSQQPLDEKFRAAVDKQLDQVTEEIQWRTNWFIYFDPILRHPHKNEPGGQYLRCERQTLRRFPKSGAILFTIRPYVDFITPEIRSML